MHTGGNIHTHKLKHIDTHNDVNKTHAHSKIQIKTIISWLLLLCMFVMCYISSALAKLVTEYARLKCGKAFSSSLYATCRSSKN